MSQLPILYSFRRCPYAIRARMAIASSGVSVELREVMLKNKPADMLAASQKGTVPVLQLPDGSVVDESIDVMLWALKQADPQAWLPACANDPDLTPAPILAPSLSPTSAAWIRENDGSFKAWLDKYKYADRFPEHDAAWYRSQAEGFLQALDRQLSASPWLSGDNMGFADVAVFPFIRQFAGVDQHWFECSPYRALRSWLTLLLGSALFAAVMEKHPPWFHGQASLVFPPHLSGI
ncbi:MAG: glutathione S-transferase [Congregibacter sp.]